jgi:hypothetical protein
MYITRCKLKSKISKQELKARTLRFELCILSKSSLLIYIDVREVCSAETFSNADILVYKSIRPYYTYCIY